MARWRLWFNKNAALRMLTADLQNSDKGIEEAARLLARGALVALPTETVYGLGADARNEGASAAIFEVKGRPKFNPLIVHVINLNAAQKLATLDDDAIRLAKAFWPGPLTLVAPLRANHGLAGLVSAGLETVALRVPAHPVAQAVLRRFDGPIAAPSANLSGTISPTTADHVRLGLGGKISGILDAGPCDVGLESTIVATDPLRILRAGGVSAEALSEVVGHPLGEDKTPGKITAPGQLASHYAPDAPVRLNATKRTADEYLIGFGDVLGDVSLSASGNLPKAAAALFDALHMANATGRPIAVAPIPNVGLGRAINDRLQRAASPKD